MNLLRLGMMQCGPIWTYQSLLHVCVSVSIVVLDSKLSGIKYDSRMYNEAMQAELRTQMPW